VGSFDTKKKKEGTEARHPFGRGESGGLKKKGENHQTRGKGQPLPNQKALEEELISKPLGDKAGSQVKKGFEGRAHWPKRGERHRASKNRDKGEGKRKSQGVEKELEEARIFGRTAGGGRRETREKRGNLESLL